MFKKLSIRWRLTIFCAVLLTFCCVGLTIVLNYSAFTLVDTLDMVPLTPAAETTPAETIVPDLQEAVPTIVPEEVQEAKRGFSIQSVLYMLLIILGGSALTYYISGKALKPLKLLNMEVKNITVHNLSKTLTVPLAKDEIAELTMSFNGMTNKLNDAFLTQKRFSASAAHELRTPLAVLQTKLDVFKKKSIHNSDEYEALIAVFGNQIGRLRGLVGNLLDMTNMDDDYETSTVCLQDLFDDIVSELSGMAENKNITLLLNCDDSMLSGNVELLYRAFYNLVENGIKYNLDGGSVQIDVAEASKGHAHIWIRDTGSGIPDEMKQLIFEPFYRVDKSRSREMGGAGLGLSIVDRIIKIHGGTIAVYDNRNRGTCFEIVL